MNDLKRRFNELRRFNAKLKKSPDKDMENYITRERDKMKEGTIQLVVDEIYDKMIKLFNDTREKFKIEDKITVEPNYKSFNLDDNGNLTFTFKDKCKNKVIKFGNINECLIPPSENRRLGVTRLKLMSFCDITYLVNIRMLL